MVIDTHAHLTWPDFKPDLDEVIKRTFEANVKTIINIGADLKSSQEAAKLDCSPIISYSSIGLHPHESSRLLTDKSIHKHVSELEKIYQENSKKVIAVGECGLDFFFEGNEDFAHSSLSELELKKLQIKLFMEHITLAKRLDLPLIIHCRDAWNDIFLSELQGLPVVFHYFTGSAEQAKKILDLDFYLSFSCVVTYPKNEWLREIIKTTPMDRLFSETDSPFSPPQEKRGQRNEPANVIEVIKTIAQVKSLSEKEVEEAIWKNTTKFFHLPD